MTVIVDYASLTQSIADWSHRADLTAGTTPFSDAFIQRAQQQIETDIPEQNFGNYIRFQESVYSPQALTNGTAPVPGDWLGPKTFQIADGSGNLGPLSFKSVTDLYSQYPQRSGQGIPIYIARDTSGVGGPAYLASSTQDFLTTNDQTVFALTIPTGGAVSSVTLDGSYFSVGTDYSITGSTLTLTTGAATGQILEVTYLTAPSGTAPSMTSQFVFGPYPDGDYTLYGTYYASAPLLSLMQTTNWMVLQVPSLTLAACMVQAAQFLENDTMLMRWNGDYQARLTALINADKAERWAGATMCVDVA